MKVGYCATLDHPACSCIFPPNTQFLPSKKHSQTLLIFLSCLVKVGTNSRSFNSVVSRTRFFLLYHRAKETHNCPSSSTVYANMDFSPFQSLLLVGCTIKGLINCETRIKVSALTDASTNCPFLEDFEAHYFLPSDKPAVPHTIKGLVSSFDFLGCLTTA